MGAQKKYKVTLTDKERCELKAMVSTGKRAAYKITHARVLLLADENGKTGSDKDKAIAHSLGIGLTTIARVRRRFVEEGLEAALSRQPQLTRRAKKLDGAGEAFLIATVCSTAPEGRSTWPLKLLADKRVTSGVVESISHETVRQTLKKTP